ncbi:unnamed protein product [Scytosiphon promiscuus]
MAHKGVIKERLLHVISASTEVAISRRVHRYKLSMRGRQENQGGVTRNGESSPMIWGWSLDAQ